MRPAVSVIVPVYKVEDHIGECARSLFSQTLDNVEYIFVNDGTPDASMEVLRSVMAEYPRLATAVRILEKPCNEGLPAARRSGFEVATGEYVAHCDSDDWMEPDMIEKMYREVRAHDADGVVCGLMRGDTPEPTGYTVTGVNMRDFILKDMVAVGEMQSLWRYMFRREVYSRGVEFPEHNQGEDHALLVQLAFHSRSIYCIGEPLYHWRFSPESLTHAPSRQAVLDRFEGACANARLVESFLERNGQRESFAPQLVALKLYCMFYLRPLLRKGECVREWRNAFPGIKGKVLCNKSITFTHKIEYLLDMYCPPFIVMGVYGLRHR